MAAALPLAGRVAAQSASPSVINGQVVRVERGDTLPVPAARVVLHRVAPTGQGPLDSVVAGADGRFRFRLVPDTAVVHLLSARHDGIEHFGTPLDLHPGDPPVQVALVVSDTSSTAPVRVAARYLLVGAPGEEGERLVLDVIVLHNGSDDTRVAADSGSATWTFEIPVGTERTVVEQGTEISPDAITLDDGLLRVSAPIAPGLRQIVLAHAILSTVERFQVPFGSAVDSVTVLAEEASVLVEGGLRPASRNMGGEEVMVWTGPMAEGSRLLLRFSPPGNRSQTLLGLLVAGMALLLVAGAVLARRGRRVSPAGPAGAAAPDPVEGLLDQLARLDQAWRERQDTVPEGGRESQEYQTRRADLRRQLDAALAARRRRS